MLLDLGARIVGVGMQIDSKLRETLVQFVHDRQPLGPPDASKVSDPAVAALLYDWRNRSFADLLKGSHIVVGRRGAGKSALVNTYEIKAELLRRTNENSVGADFRSYMRALGVQDSQISRIPDVVERVDIPEEMFRLRAAVGEANVPSVELLAKYWKLRILFLANNGIRKRLARSSRDNVFYQASAFWRKIRKTPHRFTERFFKVESSLEGFRLDETAVMDFAALRQDENSMEQVVTELMDIASASRLRVVVIIDSMETYASSEFGQAMMGGLLKAAGELVARQFPNFQLSVCLPAERYEELADAATNTDKDFFQVQFLHWNAHELMHVAACRLLLYFRVHQQSEYEAAQSLDISSPTGLRMFWLRYFPPKIKNMLGQDEDVFRYILRHTLMLPRQLLMILNSIGAEVSKTANQPPFGGAVISEDKIRKGITNSEIRIRNSIVQMYKQFIPNVGNILTTALPELLAMEDRDPSPRVINYGRLYKVWNRHARASMAGAHLDEFGDFSRLLFSMGVLGVVEAGEEDAGSTYINGRFEFSEANMLEISSKSRMCIHPIFSSGYGNERTATADKRVVLPRAVAEL